MLARCRARTTFDAQEIGPQGLETQARAELKRARTARAEDLREAIVGLTESGGSGDVAPVPDQVRGVEQVEHLGHQRQTRFPRFDGLDYGLTRELIARGRLPNFAKLQQSGSFAALETSIPPQSPVAWSSFITGLDPGGHGIFDFIHRDPATMVPYLSTSRTHAASALELRGLGYIS